MKECPACRHCFPEDFNNCPSDGDALIRTIPGDTVLERRYQLDLRLGQGGMGIVFKARHIQLKSPHAIKVILPDLVGNDPMLVTRFRQEAIVAARIRHRNIVNVTDYGVAGGMPFLVMEFVKGKSLHDFLAEQGRLSPERALEIMAAVCAGVGAAHQQGIVHRDLKPLNIMLQDDVPYSDGVKILDFGLAKIKSGEFLGSFVAAQTSGLMGSPFYMAPELWSDEEPDKLVDVYSLGIILFQILTDDLPFKGATIPAIMTKHLTMAPPSLTKLGVNVTPALDRVIAHALAKKRQDRLQSVEDFLNELREAVLSANAGFVRLPIREAEGSLSVTMFLPETGSGEVDRTGQTDSGEVSLNELTSPDSQQRIEHEADRLRHEFEEAQLRADEARQRADEAARRRAEEEAARRQAEEQAARKLAEEEAARKRAAEAAHRQAEEVAARKRAEDQATLKLAEELARKRAEDEAARRHAEEEAARLANEVAAAQRRAEEARLLAEEEARRRTEEEAARWRAEEKARQLAAEVEEVQRRVDEARQRAEEEAGKRAEQEKARKLAETEMARERAEAAARIQAEEETTRKRAAAEADRLAREVAEAQQRADEARQRAEDESRKRVIEEEARKRAEEEAHRLALEVAEVQRRAEEGARRLAEQEAAEETARHRAAEEARVLAEKEAKRKRDEEEYVAAIERDRIAREKREFAPLQHTLAAVSLNETLVLPSETQTESEPIPIDPAQTWQHKQPLVDVSVQDPKVEPKRNYMLPIVAGLGGTLIVVGLAAVVIFYQSRKPPLSRGQNPRPDNSPVQELSPSATPNPHLVKIEGGTFQMGRSAGLNSNAPFDMNQYPAHSVSVKTFWMDKTEVTNEEYGAFVRETKHPPPADWNKAEPPPGKLQSPVTKVSLNDAKSFSEWRSRRDRKEWRLPTEEEWEYAARNGARGTSFPWGNEWLEDRANVDSSGPVAVASYPQGATQSGVLDLIGNVWEWTSTKAAAYPGGGDKMQPFQGEFVIRGGGYINFARGPEAITATRRSFLPPSAKEAVVGFRLVRNEP